jgi:GDP-mannose 4,6 dehydratase
MGANTLALDVQIADAWNWMQKSRRDSSAMILVNFEKSHAFATLHPGYRRVGISRLASLRKAARPRRECPMRDNFFAGDWQNIEHLLDDKHFELIRHDVTFPLYVEVDEIYNLACLASPIHYQHDPVQTTKPASHGAINMLGLAKRLKSKILQASTPEVYGDPNIHPQTENYLGHVMSKHCLAGTSQFMVKLLASAIAFAPPRPELRAAQLH